MGLTEDIAASELNSFYLVNSQEEYLRVDAARRWLRALEDQNPQVVHYFRAPRWDMAELENILLTVPMFGDAVAVIIHDIEKTHAAHQERLVSLLTARGAHVSVLATAGTIDKRKKFYKALAKMGPVEAFGRIYENQRPGWVFNRSQLIDGLRDDQHVITDRAIDVQVANLRKKLGKFGSYIQTVRGVGYRMQEIS